MWSEVARSERKEQLNHIIINAFFCGEFSEPTIDQRIRTDRVAILLHVWQVALRVACGATQSFRTAKHHENLLNQIARGDNHRFLRFMSFVGCRFLSRVRCGIDIATAPPQVEFIQASIEQQNIVWGTVKAIISHSEKYCVVVGVVLDFLCGFVGKCIRSLR